MNVRELKHFESPNDKTNISTNTANYHDLTKNSSSSSSNLMSLHKNSPSLMQEHNHFFLKVNNDRKIILDELFINSIANNRSLSEICSQSNNSNNKNTIAIFRRNTKSEDNIYSKYADTYSKLNNKRISNKLLQSIFDRRISYDSTIGKKYGKIISRPITCNRINTKEKSNKTKQPYFTSTQELIINNKHNKTNTIDESISIVTEKQPQNNLIAYQTSNSIKYKLINENDKIIDHFAKLLIIFRELENSSWPITLPVSCDCFKRSTEVFDEKDFELHNNDQITIWKNLKENSIDFSPLHPLTSTNSAVVMSKLSTKTSKFSDLSDIIDHSGLAIYNAGALERFYSNHHENSSESSFKSDSDITLITTGQLNKKNTQKMKVVFDKKNANISYNSLLHNPAHKIIKNASDAAVNNVNQEITVPNEYVCKLNHDFKSADLNIHAQFKQNQTHTNQLNTINTHTEKETNNQDITKLVHDLFYIISQSIC